jgi:hypothetical protein
MNFEQLRLQMHMRSLYERLGAMDAELMIVDAFVKEQARHERILQLQWDEDNRVRPIRSLTHALHSAGHFATQDIKWI